MLVATDSFRPTDELALKLGEVWPRWLFVVGAKVLQFCDFALQALDRPEAILLSALDFTERFTNLVRVRVLRQSRRCQS